MSDMCMITYVPAGVEVPWEGLENGTIENPDGHGWAVAHGSTLLVGRSLDPDVALATFESARRELGPSSVALFHSRFATDGAEDESNVHPFAVGTDSVMMHNGVMPTRYRPTGKDPRSDTRIFAETVAPRFTSSGTGVPSRRGARELASLVGMGNKLAFLSVRSGAPRVRLVGARMGTFEGGAWFSSSSYLGATRWATWRRSAAVTPPSPAWQWDEEGEDRTPLPSLREPKRCEVCGSDMATTWDPCPTCQTCPDCLMGPLDCQCWRPRRPGKLPTACPRCDSTAVDADEYGHGWVAWCAECGHVWDTV